MRPDKIDNGVRQTVFLRQGNTIGHMTNDNASTLVKRQFGVRILCSLILCEIRWVLHFSYIMIESTGAYKLYICPDLGGCLRSEDGHLDRMLKGPRRHLRELTEQRRIDVAQLNQTDIGNVAESTLHQIDEQVAEHEEDQIHTEIENVQPVSHLYPTVLHQRERKLYDGISEENQKGRPNQLQA